MLKKYTYTLVLLLIHGSLASQGKFLLLLGPSGVGKSTIIQHLKELDERFEYVTPMTTRPLREGEKDKVHISFEEMNRLQEAGQLLTINNIYGIYYATPKSIIDNALKNGLFPVLDWPIQKMEIMQSSYPDHLFVVYVAPDDIEELYRRLSLDKRDTDGKRYALGTEEIQNLLAGNYDSLIDMKVINEKNRSKEVAQSIYRQYIASLEQ